MRELQDALTIVTRVAFGHRVGTEHVHLLDAFHRVKRPRILMVDDDVDLCSALQVTIERAGYDVLTAASRAEGMEKIQSERPDLIILDAVMETWQDGFEMARDLKGDPRFKHVPILMLTIVEEKTGLQMRSTAADPEWLPVDGFLDKPVTPGVLLAEIRRLLQRPRTEALSR